MHRINRRLKKLDLQNKQTTLSSSGPVEQEITAFQGVVAEVRESVVLVLTPNGELLRVVVTDLPKIGQTLSGVVFDKIKDTVDNHLETFFVTTETSVLEVQQDETIYNIGDEFVGEVVDIQTSSVLVMTPDFDFIEVDTNGQMYEVGEEIVFYEDAETVSATESAVHERGHNTGQRASRKKLLYSRWIRYLSGLATVLLLFFVGLPTVGSLHDGIKKSAGINRAYAASLYVESESNVQIDVDSHQRVLRALPIDKQAQDILKDIKVSNAPLDQFLLTYFKTAEQRGYLKPKDKTIISVTPNPKKKQAKEKIKETLENIANSVVLKIRGVKVLTVTVPPIVVEKAKRVGATPGRYLIYLVSLEEGEHVPLETLKNAPVNELVHIAPNSTIAAILNDDEDQLAQLAKEEEKTQVAVAPPEETKSENITNEEEESAPNNPAERAPSTKENKPSEAGTTPTKTESKPASDGKDSAKKSTDTEKSKPKGDQTSKEQQKQSQPSTTTEQPAKTVPTETPKPTESGGSTEPSKPTEPSGTNESSKLIEEPTEETSSAPETQIIEAPAPTSEEQNPPSDSLSEDKAEKSSEDNSVITTAFDIIQELLS